MVIKQKVYNRTTVFNGAVAVELWVEKFDTEPDELINGVVAKPQEAVDAKELVHRQGRLCVVGKYAKRIENNSPQ